MLPVKSNLAVAYYSDETCRSRLKRCNRIPWTQLVVTTVVTARALLAGADRARPRTCAARVRTLDATGGAVADPSAQDKGLEDGLEFGGGVTPCFFGDLGEDALSQQQCRCRNAAGDGTGLPGARPALVAAETTVVEGCSCEAGLPVCRRRRDHQDGARSSSFPDDPARPRR